MRAADIMTQDVAVVTASEPVSRAAEIMRDHDVGIVPVVHDRESMRLEGVITDRDIAVRCVTRRHGSAGHVGRYMTAGHLWTVSPSADVMDVIAVMEHDQVRRLPVVEDGDRLVGIIALADVATHLGRTRPVDVEVLLKRLSAPRLAPTRHPSGLYAHA